MTTDELFKHIIDGIESEKRLAEYIVEVINRMNAATHEEWVLYAAALRQAVERPEEEE